MRILFNAWWAKKIKKIAMLAGNFYASTFCIMCIG